MHSITRSLEELRELIGHYNKILQEEPENLEICQELVNLNARLGLVSNVTDLYLKIAHIHMEKNEFKKALDTCHRVIMLEPEHIKAREKLIEIYGKTGNSDKLQEQSLLLSRIYNMKNDSEKALSYLHRAIEADPDNLDISLELASLNIRYGYIKQGIKQYKELARLFSEKNDISRAIEVYKKVTLLESDNESLFALATLYRQAGYPEEAKNTFRFILKYDLENIQALTEFGLICEETGERDSAIIAFKKIIEKEPENILVREKLGRLYDMKGHSEEAVKHYYKGAELYLKENSKDKAIEMCNLILNLEPYHEKAGKMVKELRVIISPPKKITGKVKIRPGFVTHRLRDYKTIIKDGAEKKKAVSVKEIDNDIDIALPSFFDITETPVLPEEALIEFVPVEPEDALMVDEINKNKQLTIEEYRRSVSENPNNINLRENLARFLYQNGLLREALEEYSFLLEQDKNNTDIYYKMIDIYNLLGNEEELRMKYLELAKLYMKKNEYQASMDICQHLIALNPCDFEARELMVGILLDRNKKKEASYQYIAFANVYNSGDDEHIDFIYEKISEIVPQDLLIHTKLGKIYEDIKIMRDKPTIEKYEKELLLNPDNSEIRFRLGLLYYESEKLENAVEQFQYLLGKAEKLLDVYNMLGLCFEKMSLENLALNQFKRGLSLKGYENKLYDTLRYNLGALYEKKKMFKEARDIYKEIWDKNYGDLEKKIDELNKKI